MQTGVVVVNYNDYDSLDKFINNIKDYKIIERIVVVDNNSSDEEKLKLKKIKNKKVKTIYLDSNVGYAGAINEGAKYLINEFGKCNIIVANSDVVIDKEKDIKELLKTLLKKDVAISAPVILEHNKLNRGWKKLSPGYEILMNIPYINRYVRRKKMLYKDEYYKDDEVKVDVVSGCFFIIKSTVLKEIGYLDSNTFLYYEENILSKEIEKLGFKILVNNNVIIIHNHSVSIDKNINKLKKYKILKKSQYYYEKNYGNANGLQLFLLSLSSNITYVFLIFYYKLLDLKK